MSVPFSNTNLRIPRGFGNLLECLAKEVLRDQPEDIPTFAAHYFTKLLKAREESGLDPAEWGAKLEDRFYNNHSFKVFKKKRLKMRQHSLNLKIILVPSNVKLDEESGEMEHGPDADIPCVGTADQTSEVLKDGEVAKEDVDIDI
uniref:RIIa domain-containing protein n=1 Tax=Cyprinus carpio TaxID=7962 RepID=A0A8C2B349_CYPCA